jgi:hypothetical protein
MVDAETVIRQKYPATDTPDLSKPALIKDGNLIYKSYPITTICDYGKPAYVKEKNRDGTSMIYEMLPMTDMPNKLKGGYKVEDSADLGNLMEMVMGDLVKACAGDAGKSKLQQNPDWHIPRLRCVNQSYKSLLAQSPNPQASSSFLIEYLQRS